LVALDAGDFAFLAADFLLLDLLAAIAIDLPPKGYGTSTLNDEISTRA
jgi:hypothetical protein